MTFLNWKSYALLIQEFDEIVDPAIELIVALHNKYLFLEVITCLLQKLLTQRI
jgi:hypothetical protein